MLPIETARVWAFLEKEPSLAGAILIGGTALALRIGHRCSYDLDFCFPAPRLPLRQIEAVVEALADGGISAQRRPYQPFMRLSWQKTEVSSILPPAEGSWKPPGLAKVGLVRRKACDAMPLIGREILSAIGVSEP